ncbi:hypothetical protein DPX84_22980 [Salmonella enterica]|uniref:Uncharacterized protein n=1 Tax=Salmonella arizonae (strain ATCC BAA-731 / CDC346-86 / RSK2980) TaxID=41514 RepID=A9MHC2_SALAR|nr:hypothetical protein SARI_03480 [Salmonella enterica subsp. arizonae serovar 62:z4,z23:-]ASO61286.1 hypothetical protein LFZ50_10495 [Salmonella enterica subsp. arizonae serovar 53:-:- str. SA20100345]EAA9218645.1 hypothetical protein [Salmonella enterica]EAC0103769.1 hypothetical protein [Salmonella enterica subsp. arizonae]EAM9239801.1 hypothetical protein [Salmonella enterica]
MTVCCIPQQNPDLYPFTHRLIHKTLVHFFDPLSANDLSGVKMGPEFKKKNLRALRKRFRYNVAEK